MQKNQNMKYYVLNGVLFTIMINLYKPFAVKFIQRIGGNDFHIALYNALPGIIAVLTLLPGTIFVRKAKNKKKITTLFFILSRSVLLFLAFVPALPTQIQPIVFVLAIAIRNFPEQVSVSLLQTYLGEIFSKREKTKAITLRNKYSVLVRIIVMLVAGNILSVIAKTNEQTIRIYQVFFIIAFCIGILEILTFLKLEENQAIEYEENKFNAMLVFHEIRKNKQFMIFLACSTLFHFGWQMGWPLMAIYQIEYLGANEMWLAIINVFSLIVTFFSYGYWNKFIDKKGNTTAVVIATSGMAINILITAISPNLYILTILFAVTGFFTSGTITVLLDLLLEVTPEENRVLYIGVHNTVINIGLAISPLVGHAIYKKTSIFTAFMVVMIIRLMGGISFYIRKKLITKNTYVNKN